MRLLILFLFPVFLSAQINRAYGVIEISSFPTSSSTGPKFAYRPVDSSFYRWISGNTWVKVIEPSIIPDTLYLTEEIGTTVKLNGDTINLTPYVLKTDTTSILAPYIKLAGWGLTKLTSTLQVDTSKVATRYYAKTLPTSIAANYLATSNGTNLVARNLFDNNTVVSILNNKPFALGQWTTAGRPTGTSGYMGWNTTLTGIDWYNGTRWATGLESTFARGTATRIPFFDANGQIVETSLFRLTGAANLFANNYYNNAIGGGYYSTDGNQGMELGSGFVRLKIFGSGASFFDWFNANGSAVIFRAYTNTRRLSANIAATTISGLTGGDYSVTSQAAVSGGSNGRDLTVHGGDADNASAGATSGNLILRGGRATSASTNPTQGTILFQTAPNTTSGAAVQRGKITQGGFWNIGADATPTEEMDVNGNLRIRDSLRLATTPAHTSIAGLATKSATGEWIGLATLGTGLSYSGGVLSATGASTWLKPELESVGNVKISSTNSLTFKQGTTRWTGSSEQLGTSITPGNIYLRKTSSGDFGATLHFADTLGVVDNDFYFEQDDRATIQTDGYGAQLNLVLNSTKLPGSFRWAYSVRTDTSAAIGEVMIAYGDRYASVTQPVTHRFFAGIQAAKSIPGFRFDSDGASGKMAFTVNSNINLRQNGKFFLAPDSTLSFDPTNDVLQLSEYDAGGKTAPALGIESSEMFLNSGAGGMIVNRKMRETTFTNSDASVTDDMLELAQDVFVYANCPAIATDSTVIDLPTPSVDYIGQVVEVCGDGRNVTPNYQVYVRGVGATLWHQGGGADPSAQTYLEVTNLSSNHNTVRFICAQPSGSTYYWILLKQQ